MNPTPGAYALSDFRIAIEASKERAPSKRMNQPDA
jgi:hypothetical protein